MIKMNVDASLKHAIDLTTVAMEHSMITISDDSKETARNVFDFYATICSALRDGEIKED